MPLRYITPGRLLFICQSGLFGLLSVNLHCAFKPFSTVMPRYVPNILFSDCWSSMGDVTFFHRDGVCFWKKKPVCKFPGTLGQMEQAEVHGRALEAWRTLEHDVQLQWNSLAVDVPSHRPPFDGTSHITGHNLFVSAYHGFAQLGDEHIPVPAAHEKFPVFSVNYSGVEVESDSDLTILFQVYMPESQEPSRYRLLTKMQFTEPGRGRKPGLMRNFPASSACSSEDCIVRVPVGDAVAAADLNIHSFQVHSRCILLDNQTGYRCDYHKLSFLVEAK